MSVADDMIEARLERDMAIGQEASRRMRNVLAFFEANEDGEWPEEWAYDEFDAALDDLEREWASRPREPWVRPGARGEVEGTVTSVLIDAIGDGS
jgi:hypothetical protein